MSYILEALKKAQAERQLGSAPTIHAPPAGAPVAHGGAASRKPLFVGLGAGALVVAAGALLLWRQHPDAPAPVAVSAPAPASVPVVPAVAQSPAAPVARVPERPAETLALSAPPPAPAAEPEPAAARAQEPSRASVAQGGRGAAPAPAPAPAPASESAAGRVPEPSRARKADAVRVATAADVAAPAPAAARTPAPEDNLPFLQQLPDAQQRDIPRVTFGGYMYSANPADRLLLVDKALRHEGEEVAPGLVLEKLLPKAAVMNYRGLRYRVAY